MHKAVVIEQTTGADAQSRGLIPAIEAIFFGAAARSYAPGPEREAFRARWLGRFLDCPRDPLLLAIAPDGRIAGYLVGTFDDAARSERFLDMPHFREHFAGACARFPAHLHINLAPEFRNLGIGSRLVDSFVDLVRAVGLPGLHVTTGDGMRNIRFYLANGFAEVGRWPRADGPMVFLGRPV